MKKKLISVLLCLTIGLGAVGLSSCSSVNLDEVVGTYYCYSGWSGGYQLSMNTYITLNKDFSYNYSFPFLLSNGAVETEEECSGKGRYNFDGMFLKLNNEYLNDRSKLNDGIFIIDEYYFCKDGVAPYEVIDGVKYAKYSDEFSAVLGCDDGAKDVTVKSTYNDLPTTVLRYAFSNIPSLESVTVESGIQSVG